MIQIQVNHHKLFYRVTVLPRSRRMYFIHPVGVEIKTGQTCQIHLAEHQSDPLHPELEQISALRQQRRVLSADTDSPITFLSGHRPIIARLISKSTFITLTRLI